MPIRFLTIKALLWILVSVTAVVAQPIFPAGVSRKVPLVERAGGIAVADFNGDGKVDLAVTDALTPVVKILFSGSESAQEHRLSVSCQRLIATDLDHDGISDLVAISIPDQKVEMLLSDGRGSFAPASPPSGFGLCTSLQTARLDEDQLDDLVLSNYFENTIWTATAVKPGPFVESSRVKLDFAPASASAGDLDGDGVAEIVSWGAEEKKAVVLQVKSGHLAVRSRLDLDFRACDVLLEDLDGDGRDELIVAGAEEGRIQILKVEGSELKTALELKVMKELSSLGAADIDADGDLDLSACSPNSGGLVVFQNLGELSFSAPEYRPCGGFPQSHLFADLNQDSLPDAVVANAFKGDLVFLLNDGRGRLGQALDLAVGGITLWLDIGFLNHDRYPDLVVSRTQKEEVSLHLSDGKGGFQSQQKLKLADFSEKVATGDLDGDGRDEIISVSIGDIIVVRVKADGETSKSPQLKASAMEGIVADDLDLDGLDDLILVGFSSSVLFSRTGETLDPQKAVKLENFNSGEACASADLNGDKYPEVISFALLDGAFNIAMNNEGKFERVITVGQKLEPPDQLAVGDLNQDGRPDLAAISSLGKVIYLVFNQGQDSWSEVQQIETRSVARGLALGDVNADGKADLVTVGFHESNALIYLSEGSGKFSDPYVFPVGCGPETLRLADMDLDGNLDVVAVSRNSGTATVLYLSPKRDFPDRN